MPHEAANAKGPRDTEQLTSLQLPVPSPLEGAGVADLQDEFANITRQTPRDPDAERAFLASKVLIARTHPTLHLQERATAVAQLVSKAGAAQPESKSAPVPGGVGYGVFYNPAFKINFSTGTAICWDIVCPNPPGGNVNTFLYVTATNRSGLGVEAFISYDGQNQTFFKVFDWARNPASPWQTNIPFSALANYLRAESAHGNSYQTIMLVNATVQTGENQWSNQVLLWNRVASRWDLVYQYTYSATLAQQTTGWVGSWGPIVETFQNAYSGTEPLGGLNIQLISRNANNQWGAWHLLGASDSYIRTDNTGFSLLFLDPNYNWAVNS
jgi:hypothetical protein